MGTSSNISQSINLQYQCLQLVSDSGVIGSKAAMHLRNKKRFSTGLSLKESGIKSSRLAPCVPSTRLINRCQTYLPSLSSGECRTNLAKLDKSQLQKAVPWGANDNNNNSPYFTQHLSCVATVKLNDLTDVEEKKCVASAVLILLWQIYGEWYLYNYILCMCVSFWCTEVHINNETPDSIASNTSHIII